MVEDINGDMFLKIVEAGDGNRHDHFLKMGEVANIHNILFAFNAYTDGAVMQTGLIKENYANIMLGFSLSDVWFIKRKYD